jgi:hypothetical protein
MEFITGEELTEYLGEQIGLWDAGDVVFAFMNLKSLHAYINQPPMVELDTIEGDKRIEEWLESEKLLCSAFQ